MEDSFNLPGKCPTLVISFPDEDSALVRHSSTSWCWGFGRTTVGVLFPLGDSLLRDWGGVTITVTPARHVAPSRVFLLVSLVSSLGLLLRLDSLLGMWDAALPLTASRCFCNWSVLEIRLSSNAFSNLFLKVMKSLLGAPEYVVSCCRHG